METRHIALFGGAFDPPHLGHVAAIRQVQNSGLVDEVWVVPAGDRSDKRYSASSADRRKMVELMLEECFPGQLDVSLHLAQIEASAKYSTTIGLLDELTRRFKEHNFYVLIGTELVRDLPTWVEPERLRKSAAFLVIERPGEGQVKPPEGYNARIVPQMPGCGVNVSSTQLRAKLSTGEIESLMPKSVAAWISKRNLYKTGCL